VVEGGSGGATTVATAGRPVCDLGKRFRYKSCLECTCIHQRAQTTWWSGRWTRPGRERPCPYCRQRRRVTVAEGLSKRARGLAARLWPQPVVTATRAAARRASAIIRPTARMRICRAMGSSRLLPDLPLGYGLRGVGAVTPVTVATRSSVTTSCEQNAGIMGAASPCPQTRHRFFDAFPLRRYACCAAIWGPPGMQQRHDQPDVRLKVGFCACS